MRKKATIEEDQKINEVEFHFSFHNKFASNDLCKGNEERKEVVIEDNEEKKEETQRFGKEGSEENNVEVQCCSPMMGRSWKESHVESSHTNAVERKKEKNKGTRKEWRKKEIETNVHLIEYIKEKKNEVACTRN